MIPRAVLLVAIIGSGVYGLSSIDVQQKEYVKDQQTISIDDETLEDKEDVSVEKFIPTHLETPEPLRAVYMTSWVAGTSRLREKLVSFIEETEINAVVIDIKDDTGRVSFLLDEFDVAKYGTGENRISDIREFIAELHAKDIYVIGRISVFQDPFLTKIRPDLALKRVSDGGIWKDRKGLAFLDPQVPEVWEYIVELAKASHAVGFDEINFDYVRFPSDGNIQDIEYGIEEGETRADLIENFFAHLHNELEGTGIVTSADLFGMTTTATDDLGIGQVLERALPYFDYIAPMVYPSHYPPNFNGYGNPNNEPYKVIHYAMSKGVERAKAMGLSPSKLRPWLQDFDYGGNYGVAEVQAQIQATYDAGLTSWMMWDPGNHYTKSAYRSTNSSAEGLSGDMVQ